ncbi:TBC1 domain family member 31 [Intoshia linei]|uniref:TBC1 domain family member 31 n=1 Tax=Intoshia linei TaxID=1819745 RepID=A0A177B8S2_9BILA|nr:TBC1 domain family member 31 [Intoshia linei]
MNILTINNNKKGCLWFRKSNKNNLFGQGCKLIIQETNCNLTRDFYLITCDKGGDLFAACSAKNNLYLFNIGKNFYKHVVSFGSVSILTMAFSIRRRNELLIATNEDLVHCIDVETGNTIATLRNTFGSINHISLHSAGHLFITSSRDGGQLWDMNLFKKKECLGVDRNDVELTQIMFLPMSDNIVSIFSNNTILVWSCSTLDCMYKLPLDSSVNVNNTFKSTKNLRYMAASLDGKWLAAVGRCQQMYIWRMDERQLFKIIRLPGSIGYVKKCQFINSSFNLDYTVISILTSEGSIRFFNIDNCNEMKSKIGGPDYNKDFNVKINTFSPDKRFNSYQICGGSFQDESESTCKYLIAVSDSGQIFVFDLSFILNCVNKPPKPKVKIIAQPKLKKLNSLKTVLDDVKSKNSGFFIDNKYLHQIQDILKTYKELPAKYRLFIWRSVLRIPENHEYYTALFDQPIHISYQNIAETFPVKSNKHFRALQRCLSALTYWSEIFSEITYLPYIVFPFIMIFINNQLIAFEIIMTFLINWAANWFEYFPNPPISLLASIEQIFMMYDSQLLNHFIAYKVTSQIYAWSLIKNLMTEVLSSSDWLIIMDHIFTNKISFIYCMILSYSVTNRCILLSCNSLKDFEYFFQRKNVINIYDLIKNAYKIETFLKNCNIETNINDKLNVLMEQPKIQYIDANVPYPIFNKYPSFVVNYQIEESKRLRKEHLEYLEKKKTNELIHKSSVNRQIAEESWFRQQKLILDAESERRKIILNKENALEEDRKRYFKL